MATDTQTNTIWDLLKKQDDATHQIQVNLNQFKWAFDGVTHGLSSEDHNYDIEAKSLALKQLCKLAKIPASFVDKSEVNLIEAIFEANYAKIEKPDVVLLTDKAEEIIRAILPGTYYRVPNWQTYGVIQKAIPNSTSVRVIGGGWQDVKTAFIVTHGEAHQVTYGSKEAPVTADVHAGVQVVCSELGGNKLTVDPILSVGGKIIAPTTDRAGNYYSGKYDDFNSEELRGIIADAASFDPTEATQALQANALNTMDDEGIREWLTELTRYKGASNSLIKKLEKSFQVVDGEAPVIRPMSATETTIYLLSLVQVLDKPLGLGLERALAYKLGVCF